MELLCQEHFLIIRTEMAGIRRVYTLFSPVRPNRVWRFPQPVALFGMLHNNILCFSFFGDPLINGHIFFIQEHLFYVLD